MTRESVPDLLTVTEARGLLRISRSSVYRLMAERRIDYVPVGDRRMIPADAIRAFIASNIVKAKAT